MRDTDLHTLIGTVDCPYCDRTCLFVYDDLDLNSKSSSFAESADGLRESSGDMRSPYRNRLESWTCGRCDLQFYYGVRATKTHSSGRGTGQEVTVERVDYDFKADAYGTVARHYDQAPRRTPEGHWVVNAPDDANVDYWHEDGEFHWTCHMDSHKREGRAASIGGAIETCDRVRCRIRLDQAIAASDLLPEDVEIPSPHTLDGA